VDLIIEHPEVERYANRDNTRKATLTLLQFILKVPQLKPIVVTGFPRRSLTPKNMHHIRGAALHIVLIRAGFEAISSSGE